MAAQDIEDIQDSAAVEPTGPGIDRPLRVAVIGAGPAGIYTADMLTKAEEVADGRVQVAIDLFDRYPTPFGLIRYGVAPDHPRIKGIVSALRSILGRGDIRFFGNVEYGRDLTLGDLRTHYDAVVFSTGAVFDAPLDVPGADLEGVHGAADFVAWYDAHPDYPREWPLRSEQVAVIGNGNVALDVARVLAKHADDMLTTEIPGHVYQGLKANPVQDVHVFGRRGPAQMKFTPLELRELGKVPDVDVIVHDEEFSAADVSEEAAGDNNQAKVMLKTLRKWIEDDTPKTASRRLHLHFLQRPAEMVGQDGRLTTLRMERTALNENGSVSPTGEFVDYPIGQVYAAIGYLGSRLPEIPFDDHRGVILNQGGRVQDEDGSAHPGLYATGWIKRGPVGLIGATKSDALETITHLLEDRHELGAGTDAPDPQAIVDTLESKGIEYTTWDGWLQLDEHEQALGASSHDAEGNPRERVKVTDRDEMVRISRA